MKVNSTNKRNINFNGFWDSKALKKTLQFAARNGTLFAGTASLICATTVRPIAILSTPNTDEQNKKVACAKSLTSTGIGYLLMLAFTLPLSNAVRNIDKRPEKFLNSETIKTLKDDAKTLKESKAYSLATQLFKLGLGFILATPKAILTAIGTPLILNKFDTDTNKEKNTQKEVSFKGKNPLEKGISKILNWDKFIQFAKKYKDSNFPMHIVAATDTLTTATFIHKTSKSKKLDKKDKKPLMYNAGISTTLSIISSYTIDRLTQKPAQKFIEKFKKANKNNPNLAEYLEGIKIAKPILIMGIVYYTIIPIISTFVSDKINKIINKS